MNAGTRAKRKPALCDGLLRERHTRPRGYQVAGCQSELLERSLKPPTALILPSVRLNRTPAAKEFKSTRSGEQSISDPFRFADVRPLHGGVNLLCFFAAEPCADKHIFGCFSQHWPAHFLFHTFVKQMSCIYPFILLNISQR